MTGPTVRATPLKHPVTIHFDGEAVPAERGEPVAAALVAAGKLSLARSAKFHRPRGPSCLRAACDGCLARVGDRPNVMTCMVPAEDGVVVSTQNTLGSREVDFLRVTDWFFPRGMNHHELFAGVPGLQGIMQTFARRVAGLGKLPGEVRPERAAVRREADVVVVGGGAAGMSVAVRAAEKGRAVEVLDDVILPRGTLGGLFDDDASPWAPLRARFEALVQAGGITLRTATTAAALYGDDLLVAGDDGVEVVAARALVLAPGAHDGVLAFEGNDVPGVMSARAASWLLQCGVVAGERVVVCAATSGTGATGMGEGYARALAARAPSCKVEVIVGEPMRVGGSSRVKDVVLNVDGKEVKAKADVLVLDVPRAPAYELLEQAGAPLEHEPRGFVPRVTGGKIREGVFAVGEVTGVAFDLGTFEGQAKVVVDAL
jgi:sarcosine oxidase subunit alpha